MTTLLICLAAWFASGFIAAALSFWLDNDYDAITVGDLLVVGLASLLGFITVFLLLRDLCEHRMEGWLRTVVWRRKRAITPPNPLP